MGPQPARIRTWLTQAIDGGFKLMSTTSIACNLGSTLRSMRFQCDYFHCIKSETLLDRQREGRSPVATEQSRFDGRLSMQRFPRLFSREK
ncbi:MULTISPECIES: hypothetical protein [unclassified Dyella]|uniref:hypothetical protein n=1 Tax=unclassified Dyella TaxID=2634549 RepID=UPI003F8F3178